MKIKTTIGGRRTQEGFTLMEVVLTVLIMSFMLTGISAILTSTRRTRDQIYNVQETMLAGPAILDMIERDLRGLLVTNRPQSELLRVESRVMGGADIDSLDFVTTTDSLLWKVEGERAIRSDVCEVGYRLRPNPESDDFFEIYRREGFGADSYEGEPFDEGRYIFLHDRVTGFDIQVYAEDGEEAEPFEEWGTATSDPEQSGLPARLEITLKLELRNRIGREALPGFNDHVEQTYRRLIRIPQSLRVEPDQIARLLIPGRPTADQAGGGGGSGDQGDGSGGDSLDGGSSAGGSGSGGGSAGGERGGSGGDKAGSADGARAGAPGGR